MDPNLEIALVSSALAVAWGYGLSKRLRRGDTQIQFKMITRQDDPGTFWTVMVIVAAAEAAFIGIAFMYLAKWLDMS